MKPIRHEVTLLMHKAELACMRGNQEKAFQFYDEARKKGSKKAKFICGTRLMVGQGCKKDFDQGLGLAVASLSRSKVENMVSALTEHYRQINDGDALMKALETYVFKSKSEAALYRVIKGCSTGQLLTMKVKQDMDKAIWFFIYQRHARKWLGRINKYLVNFLVRIESIKAQAIHEIGKRNEIVADYQAHKAVDDLIQVRLVERIEALKEKLRKLGVSSQELINI